MQASYPLVRHFSKNTYKAGTQTWCITEHPGGGPVYFANNDGLLEYDGTSWECYPIGNGTNVRSVFFDDESGRIYAGGYKEFGYYTVDNNAGISYRTLVSGYEYEEERMTEIWAIHKIGKTTISDATRLSTGIQKTGWKHIFPTERQTVLQSSAIHWSYLPWKAECRCFWTDSLSACHPPRF